MPYFYKFVNSGTLLGLLQSTATVNYPYSVLISQKEYESLGGVVTHHDDKSPLANLQEENQLLKAQLKAATDRSDFLEDCVAEMAGVVYST